jgi:catechol 2,3-dioxygenase-like lactoylglutathione lyase family enzyme
MARANALGCTLTDHGDVVGPDGIVVRVQPQEAGRGERIIAVALRVADLAASLAWWTTVAGASVVSVTDDACLSPHAFVAFGDPLHHTALKLVEVADGRHVDHGSAFGRLAVAVDSAADMAGKIVACGLGGSVQTPPVTLHTDHKAGRPVLDTRNLMVERSLNLHHARCPCRRGCYDRAGR